MASSARRALSAPRVWQLFVTIVALTTFAARPGSASRALFDGVAGAHEHAMSATSAAQELETTNRTAAIFPSDGGRRKLRANARTLTELSCRGSHWHKRGAPKSVGPRAHPAQLLRGCRSGACFV